jgi:hypothetical protein
MESHRSPVEINARNLEGKIPGLKITFKWSNNLDFNYMARKVKNPDGTSKNVLSDKWGEEKVIVNVTGMPVGIRWDNENFLKVYLKQL